MEEKILLPAAQRLRGGQPLSIAHLSWFSEPSFCCCCKSMIKLSGYRVAVSGVNSPHPLSGDYSSSYTCEKFIAVFAKMGRKVTVASKSTTFFVA
jgi:hypothetical protein